MSPRRIIACLDVANGAVVKGVRFREHEVLGPVADFAARYNDADELVIYDIGASPAGTTVAPDWIAELASAIDVPFCVAGGIRDVASAEAVLNAGASKISVNSPALEHPELLRELVAALGAERVVVGIDSEAVPGDTWRIRSHTGRTETTKNLGLATLDWVRTVSDFGVGEIVLNSMNNDGVRRGYDIEQLQAVTTITDAPIVASGGAGSVGDFVRVFTETSVSGALAASVFHRGTVTIRDVRRALEAV